MTHVAMMIPTLDRIGGAERQVMQLASGLCSRGWRVTVIALSGSGGSAKKHLRGDGVEFLSLEMRKGLADPRGWLRLHRWLRRERPEIVHAHLSHAVWIARWSRLAAPLRTVIGTVHTSATGTLGRRLGYRCSRWLPDCVTTVGEAVREAYVGSGMVASAQCRVIPNGVDTDVWKPDRGGREALRQELAPGSGFLWLAAGRLEAVKDYPTLLHAFAQTREPSWLAIAGAGPLEHDLRELAHNLGVSGRVRFLGFVRDVRPSMQAADAFLLSSRWEGLPMGLIEAAACGLPAVATDVPGSREVVINGETGWLAPAGDAARLAGKMTCVMRASADERRAMGQRARQIAVEKFSLAAVLDRWEKLYVELLARNPAPRRWAGRKGGPISRD